jgi:hypothetical protein
MHPEAYRFIAEQAKQLSSELRIIEFGSRNVNGSVRSLFKAPLNYVGIDISDGPDVDVVADAGTWRPHNWKADVVVCCEVMEHTPAWKQIIESAAATLAADGVFLMSAACEPRPSHSAIDGGPIRDDEYYQNINPTELSATLTDLFLDSVVRTHPRGDVYALARSPFVWPPAH